MIATSLQRHAGPRPDLARIVAMSAAISLNASLLLMALRPLAPQRVVLPVTDTVPVQLLPVHPPPPAPPAPPEPLPLVPHRLPVPVRHRVQRPLPTPTPSPMSQPEPLSPAQVVPVAVPATHTHTATPAASVQLTYLRAPPPRYPMAARRASMQGTVVLRVRVDAQGRPREVEVARGSGFSVLDRAARRQVLRAWRFVPARIGGRPVAAWVEVPVVFRLD